MVVCRFQSRSILLAVACVIMLWQQHRYQRNDSCWITALPNLLLSMDLVYVYQRTKKMLLLQTTTHWSKSNDRKLKTSPSSAVNEHFNPFRRINKNRLTKRLFDKGVRVAARQQPDNVDFCCCKSFKTEESPSLPAPANEGQICMLCWRLIVNPIAHSYGV